MQFVASVRSQAHLQWLMGRQELGLQSAALGLVSNAAGCQHYGSAPGEACLLANQLDT